MRRGSPRRFGALLAALLAALWAGVMIAIAALVAPALFALLPLAEAGRVAGRIFAQEAPGSIAVAVVVILLERVRARDGVGGSQFGLDLGLALGVVFCAVAGYYAVQPMMDAARAGEGRLSFGALHGISTAFFGLKGLLMLALAWRLGGGPSLRPAPAGK